jgi:hypothetical protein
MVSGVEGVRPAWWQALHGDDPFQLEEIIFNGFQLEEIIFNRLHNEAWCPKEADLYVGPA